MGRLFYVFSKRPLSWCKPSEEFERDIKIPRLCFTQSPFWLPELVVKKVNGMPRRTIKDTDKSRNFQVEVTGQLSLDAMEEVLSGAASALGLTMSHITTLSRKKYPNNRHWHFKEDLKAKGCLDVTYWPAGPLFWITIRNYEPEWVHRSGEQLARVLEERFAEF